MSKIEFCDYLTNPRASTMLSGSCGTPTRTGHRCKKHKDKPQRELIKKGIRFSGDSSFREKIGSFQAKVKL